MNRREFLTTLVATAAVGGARTVANANSGPRTAERSETAEGRARALPMTARPAGFAWGMLMHFGMNQWGDWDGSLMEAPENQFQRAKQKSSDAAAKRKKESGPQNHLRFDYGLWQETTARMAKRGLNMIVIDMGEAVKLPSRPELAVSDSWDTDRFVKELARLRGLGLEPIPKFNFSACHDAWLKDYGHQMGAKAWYDVTADVIRDTCEIFGRPRYFHIGFEEEFGDKYERPDDLWWHDLYHLVREVEKNGSRTWAWTDYPAWRPLETFAKKMPKSVLQSAWWYAEMRDLITCPDPRMFIKAGLFAQLEKLGYDQIPCGSNYCTDKNMAEIVRTGDAVVKGGRLKGYLMTSWHATTPNFRQSLLDAADQLGAEI